MKYLPKCLWLCLYISHRTHTNIGPFVRMISKHLILGGKFSVIYLTSFSELFYLLIFPTASILSQTLSLPKFGPAFPYMIVSPQLSISFCICFLPSVIEPPTKKPKSHIYQSRFSHANTLLVCLFLLRLKILILIHCQVAFAEALCHNKLLKSFRPQFPHG